MAKPPDKPKKPRDYARPTRSKAHRPDSAPTDPALEKLLNPGIAKGTAGMGSGTGLQPPPDNSFERRADRRGEHTARKSVVKGFDESPQSGYVGSTPFKTRDRSRNVWWLAIPSMGESWHNLHHADPTAARHGVLPGQLDTSARAIRWFEQAGWVYDVRWPSQERIESRRAA